MNFHGHKAEQASNKRRPSAARIERRRARHVATKERDEVRASLGDNKMIDIEKLSDARQRGVSVGIGCVCPRVESRVCCRRPGYNVSGRVLAFKIYGLAI